MQKESVALAERLIDESEIRGYQLHVEAARFELKGQYDASKKKKKSKDYRKRMKAQQKYDPSCQNSVTGIGIAQCFWALGVPLIGFCVAHLSPLI